MDETVLIRQYNKEELPPVNVAEVWRYAGYRGMPDMSEADLNAELSDVIAMAEKELIYKVVYLKAEKLPFSHNSVDLEKTLNNCEGVCMFAATLGIGIDRLIAKVSRISPLKGLLFQALGAERVEALCDYFCEEIEKATEGKSLTMRFSPGYGDLPLETQRDFFRILDCNRKVGISLNESLLMSPSKSVTAIFGIKSGIDGSERKDWCTHKCEACPNINCEYRGI